MHKKIPQKPASIRCKDIARSLYIYLYQHEQPDDWKSPAYFCIHLFYLYRQKNRMIVNHLRLYKNDEHIIWKTRLMSLSSAYSPIQLYIQRYNNTHLYIKTCHKIFPYDFHNYLYVHLSSARDFFVTTFIKTPRIYEKMTIWPRNSTQETGWVNTKEPRTAPPEIFSDHLNMHRRTLLLQRPTKWLNPLHA